MQSDSDVPGDDLSADKKQRRRPRAALEEALDSALERLDHQVEDTKSYLAKLDEQDPGGKARRARKRDSDKPSGK